MKKDDSIITPTPQTSTVVVVLPEKDSHSGPIAFGHNRCLEEIRAKNKNVTFVGEGENL